MNKWILTAQTIILEEKVDLAFKNQYLEDFRDQQFGVGRTNRFAGTNKWIFNVKNDFQGPNIDLKGIKSIV